MIMHHNMKQTARLTRNKMHSCHANEL